MIIDCLSGSLPTHIFGDYRNTHTCGSISGRNSKQYNCLDLLSQNFYINIETPPTYLNTSKWLPKIYCQVCSTCRIVLVSLWHHRDTPIAPTNAL